MLGFFVFIVLRMKIKTKQNVLNVLEIYASLYLNTSVCCGSVVLKKTGSSRKKFKCSHLKWTEFQYVLMFVTVFSGGLGVMCLSCLSVLYIVLQKH